MRTRASSASTSSLFSHLGSSGYALPPSLPLPLSHSNLIPSLRVAYIQPAIHEIPNPKLINTSVDMFRVNVLESAGASASIETLLTSPGSLTDVRDVAEAHVLATTTAEAGGERFLISSGSFSWQKFCQYPFPFTLPFTFPFSLSRFSATEVTDVEYSFMTVDTVNASGIKANTGFPGEAERAPITFDSAKASRILGFKPRSLQEIAVDTARELLRRPGAVSV